MGFRSEVVAFAARQSAAAAVERENMSAMDQDGSRAALATWAARHLPARLSACEAAKLLGFAEHDIQILMGTGKLTPLGDPAPNAPKWFAAIEMIQLAADRDWLNRATREVSKYWRQKRERQLGNGDVARA
jgi:hypothetical protein